MRVPYSHVYVDLTLYERGVAIIIALKIFYYFPKKSCSSPAFLLIEEGSDSPSSKFWTKQYSPNLNHILV